MADPAIADYCIDKAAGPGSDLYYALLFTDRRGKAGGIGLGALSRELTDVIAECAEPAVARLKFRWWQEEIGRLYQRRPRHPVTRHWLAGGLMDRLPEAGLLAVVGHFERLLFIEQPDSFEEGARLFEPNAGALWGQYGRLAGITEKPVLALLRRSGALYCYLSCLQQPQIYISQARCIVPKDRAPQSRLLAIKANPGRGRHDGFGSLLDEIMRGLKDASRQIPRPCRPRLKPILTLNQLAFQLAKEIKADGAGLLTKKTALTPLCKLRLAWFTHLRLKYFAGGTAQGHKKKSV